MFFSAVSLASLVIWIFAPVSRSKFRKSKSRPVFTSPSCREPGWDRAFLSSSLARMMMLSAVRAPSTRISLPLISRSRPVTSMLPISS